MNEYIFYEPNMEHFSSFFLILNIYENMYENTNF